MIFHQVKTFVREVIAKSDIQPILTEGRSKIEVETQEIIQNILDDYESGIQITQVQTQKADPPDQVIDAFRDVQAARADNWIVVQCCTTQCQI